MGVYVLLGNILLDLFVFLLIATGLYIGWQRGFICVVLKTFAGLFSAVFAFRFFEGFAATLKEKYVHAFIQNGLTNALSGLSDGATAEGLLDGVPEALKKLASIVGIDLAGMAEKAVESGKNAVQGFVAAASDSISQLLSSVVAFLVLFALCLFVLRVLSIPLSKIIMRIPIIGTANRALGLLSGAFATMIIAWIFVQLFGFLDESIGLGFVEVKDCIFSGIFYRFHIFS